MIAGVTAPEHLRGEIDLPPDKSISQRAAIFALLHEGISVIENYSSAQDPQSTLQCVRQLGAEIEINGSTLRIQGKGRHRLLKPELDLDCGNSGTAMRLLAGLLTGAGISAKLVGDPSLCARTMARIILPLEQMGAHILARNQEYAPLFVTRMEPLQAIRYELPIASAQLKSSILLAGLFGEEPTSVIELIPSRDHTERLLNLNVEEEHSARKISASLADDIPNQSYKIPGDFSAAAFWLVAGAIHPNAEIILKNVGLNPTRSALLHILEEMGANISITNQRSEGAEPVGDIIVKTSELKGVTVNPAIIPNCIDELPAAVVAMLFAEGTSRINGAGELRHKETDRLAALTDMLQAVGADYEEQPDGLAIHGNPEFTFPGATFNSFHDHRIAMAAAILGLRGAKKSRVLHAECVAVSFPGFWDVLEILSR